MEYTQNYALRKPGLNEYANVGDLNYNSDKIDSQMKKNQDVDGEVYDPTSTSANAYEAGDYVINPDDGLMYVCNGTTYGTWDATKWDHTTEFDEIQKAMASGGESELADLHDVDITNPTDGQALLYDPTSLKWHNSDLPDADVTKAASGNPIEFTDGADAPLVKCVTEIQGYQDLHGQDKPWVGGAGKNKLQTTGTSTTISGVTFTVNDDGTVKVNGTATGVTTWIIGWITIESGNTYTVSGSPNNPSVNSYWIDVRDGSSVYNNWTEDNPTFTATETKQVNVRIRVASGYTINNLVFKPQIELGSAATTFTPYSNICPITAYTEGEIEVRDGDGNSTTHTTTYPSAIYRGSEDVVNGTAVCEKKKTIISSGIQLYGNYGVDDATLFYWNQSLSDIAPYSETASPSQNRPICNFYEAITQSNQYNMKDFEFRTNSSLTTSNRFYFRDSRFSTAEEFNAYIADNPIEIAYPLTNPTTSSVTPTNLPIKSLSGYNHIESSTGEMEIEYFPAKEQPLIDLIQSSQHVYSTQEQVVGKWVDGKDIYERSIDLGSFSVGSWSDHTIESSTNISLLIDYDGYVIESDIVYALPDPSIRIKRTNDGSLIFTAASSWDVTSGYITIHYTKVTTNNRSLAKSAPTEEIKEEQVEELKEETKEEPTEEVKEEVKEEETIDPETNEEAKR